MRIYQKNESETNFGFYAKTNPACFRMRGLLMFDILLILLSGGFDFPFQCSREDIL